MEKASKGIGVIDALSAGFDLMARRFWVIAIPIALNLLIWLGPRLSLEPLVRQIADLMRSGLALPANDYAQVMQDAAAALGNWGAQSNLFVLLVAGFLGLPNLPLANQGTTTLTLSNWAVAIALAAALLAGGLYLGTVYLSTIAHQVRGDRTLLGQVLGLSARYAWRLLVFGGVLLGLVAALSLPLLMGVGVLALISIGAATLVTAVLTWGALLLGVWLFFYLFFVADAIVLDDANVRQAVTRSLVVVRRNPGATLVLILVSLVITGGLNVIWRSLGQSTAGTVAAMIANAYVGSGLVAASLIFYGSRWRAVRQEIAAVSMNGLRKAQEQKHLDQSDT